MTDEVKHPVDAVRSVLTRLLALTTVVFLLFGPHVATYFSETTRYFTLWQRRDAVVLAGVIVLLAIAALAVGQVARHSRRQLLISICEQVFVLAFAAGLVANLCHYLGRWGMSVRPGSIVTVTVWFLIGAVVVYSFANRGCRLPRVCTRVCIVVSPAVALVLISLLIKRPFSYRQDAISPVVHASEASTADGRKGIVPVYVFIFDEWSPERTFLNGRVSDEFPHIAAFARRAVVFNEAHSPGVFTKGIMPRLLFQTELWPEYRDGQVGFLSDGALKPASEFTSLFRRFSDRGYETVMVGTYLPYAAWLDGQIDLCRSYSLYPLGDGLAGKAGRGFWSAMCHWTDPWTQTVTLRYKLPLRDRDMLRLYEGVESDIAAVVSRPLSQTFAVFHHMLPHEPYIINPDGTYRGVEPGIERSNVNGYLRNLKRLDVLVGRSVQIMQQAGTFDHALVVLTSDHSWRWDPNRQNGTLDAPRTHVPLLVKLPFQREPVNVPHEVKLQSIEALLLWASSSEARPDLVRDFVAARPEAELRQTAVDRCSGSDHPASKLARSGP